MKEYLIRYLEIFNNDEDGYLVDSIKLTVDEKSVSGITVDDLKTLFILKKEDSDMYMAYEIQKRHIRFFEEKLKIKFNKKKYSYYIQARLVPVHLIE